VFDRVSGWNAVDLVYSQSKNHEKAEELRFAGSMLSCNKSNDKSDQMPWEGEANKLSFSSSLQNARRQIHAVYLSPSPT
jgi:hypothetical protein